MQNDHGKFKKHFSVPSRYIIFICIASVDSLMPTGFSPII